MEMSKFASEKYDNSNIAHVSKIFDNASENFFES